MIIQTTDSQVVGETLSVLFSTIQQGPTSAVGFIKNSGVNTMNYRFQEFNGTAWVDIDDPGTPLNNTLTANQVRAIEVVSNYPQVQMVGNASGGALLEFSLTRYANRASGGPLPIINL